MIQPVADAIAKAPTETYLIIFIAIFLAEKVIGMSIKLVSFLRVKDRPEKDETREFRDPCLQGLMNSQVWETHKTETHDTNESSKRQEISLGILKRESLLQTTEIKKQTKALETANKHLDKIAKNGDKEKA